MLVITCVGVAGIIVLLALFHWIRTHPMIVAKEPEGARDVLGRRLGGAAAGSPEGTATAARPGEAGAMARQSTGPEGQLQGDPKLAVTRLALVGAGAVGEKQFACGRVRSKYTSALRGISVTAYVDGLPGPSVYYPYVPPGGTVRYCIPFHVQDLDEDRIKIIAGGEPAGADLVVWEISQEEIRRAASASPETTVWTGRARNLADVPVKNIRIILDYYDDEGVWGGRAEGRLEDRTTLGPGSSGLFRVTTGELNALEVATSRILVARAVAEKL